MSWNIWHDFMDEYVYVEAGNNYHEVGKLIAVQIDQMGRAIGILNDSRRVNFETEGNAEPSYLLKTGDGLYITDLSVTHIQLCRNRWSAWKDPK